MSHPVYIWIVAGLLAGGLARTAMRSHRDFGLIGDLTTGCLGAVLGGWLLRTLSVLAPNNLTGHVVVALIGAATLLVALRLLRHVAGGIRGSTPASRASAISDLESQLRTATAFERNLLTKFLRRRPVAADVNTAFDAQLTFGERIADQVAAFGGSWPFIGLFFVVLIGWLTLNAESAKPFDPYPFILLNLILSCLAAIQAPVIMMSQNRQAARDRLDARNDYEVNVRAEVEIMALHEKLDAVRQKEMLDMMRALEQQVARLTAIEAALNAGRKPPAA